MDNSAQSLSQTPQDPPIDLPNSIDQGDDMTQSTPSGFNFFLLIVIIIVILMIGIGVFYFVGFTKASHNILNDPNQKLDYNLNPLYLNMATVGWKKQLYQGMNIKYPSDFQIKTFDIGTGPTISFSKSANGSGYAIAINDLSANTLTKNCQEFMNKALLEATNANESSNNRNGPKSTSISKLIETNNGKVPLVMNDISLGGYNWKNTYFCFKKNEKEYGGFMQVLGTNNPEYYQTLITVVNSIN